MSIDVEAIKSALSAVIDPNTGKDLTSKKAAKNIWIEAGRVEFDIELGYPARSQFALIAQLAEEAMSRLLGVLDAKTNVSSKIVAHAVQRGIKVMSNVKNIIAVASGKGRPLQTPSSSAPSPIRPLMRSPVFCLLAFFCLFNTAVPTFAAKPGEPAISDTSFRRGAPLPRWAQPLAEMPTTARTEATVVRLSESQSWVGDTPATLVNRAVQVNEKSALGIIGEVSLNYYPVYQKLLLHRVAIIRDGKVSDRTASVAVRLLQRESAMESGMYGGATTAHLLLDDVRVGDTLWLTYTTEGANPVFGKRWSDDFVWEGAAPIELRRVTVMHARQRPLQWRQIGDFRGAELEPQVDESGGVERLRFEERGIQPLDEESGIPSDYFAARVLQFSEYPDWHAVATWADGLFPKAANSPALNNLAQQFMREPGAAAQASAALHWVQNQVRYFSVSMGENSHRPQPPETVIARRYGDCKDKSYLLVSLLDRLGIEARPVLLASEAPKVPARLIPAPSWFDHVIVRVRLEGRDYYVDPTNEGQAEPLDALPDVFPGASGLVVAPDIQGLTLLPQRTETVPSYEVVEKFDIPAIDGDATLETRLIYRGQNADSARLHFPALSPNELKKDVLALYEKKYPGITLRALPSYHDDAVANAVEVDASFTVAKPIEHKDKRYFFPYESKIIDGTVALPDNIARSYPLAPRRSGYIGRYLLSVNWPANLRMQEAPFSHGVATRYFDLHEQYLFHGNRLDYRIDYDVKADAIVPAEMQDYAARVKKLNDSVEGTFNIAEDNFMPSQAFALPMRDLDVFRVKSSMEQTYKNFTGTKDDSRRGKFGCELMLSYLSIADALGDSGADGYASVEQAMRDDIIEPASMNLTQAAYLTGPC